MKVINSRFFSGHLTDHYKTKITNKRIYAVLLEISKYRRSEKNEHSPLTKNVDYIEEKMYITVTSNYNINESC